MMMFGTVAVAGFNILREIEMDNRAFVILAISLSAGLGVTFLPEALEQFPAGAKSVLESGIGTGSICALVLNLVVPHAKVEDEPEMASYGSRCGRRLVFSHRPHQLACIQQVSESV